MLVNTNVVVRHLVGEPVGQARRATAFLANADRLYLTDVVVAELTYVLESVYQQSRAQVASCLRAVLALDSVRTDDEASVLRAATLYEMLGIHFAEAYLAARAEGDDGRVASFDRDLDRVPTVRRVEP